MDCNCNYNPSRLLFSRILRRRVETFLNAKALKIATFSERNFMHCQNCGQLSTHESNFCRFCGKPFSQSAQNENFTYAPPRPYVWKTDEFQVSKNQARKAGSYNQAQPLNYQNAAFVQTNRGQQPLAQQSQWVAYGYRCPRCSSQLMPKIEKRISAAGWVVFAVLLVVFFPLFWVGLLIKEEIKVCPVCSLKIA